MIKIGDKEQIFSTYFLVPNNQEAQVDVPIFGATSKMSFEFRDKESDDASTGEWTTVNDVMKVVFKGWKSPLGTTFKELVKYGEVDGKKLYFQVAHKLVGESNLVHLFLYVEGS
jgi:hypothetical protein